MDFLTKTVAGDTLVEAVQRALARDASQREARQEADELRARFASLTPREREVFDHVTAGLLNKQIAGAMPIAERTVKLHRARLMEKLGVASAAELGRLAERLRWLSEGGSAAGVEPPTSRGSL